MARRDEVDDHTKSAVPRDLMLVTKISTVIIEGNYMELYIFLVVEGSSE